MDRARANRLLEAYLAGRLSPCPKCGYDLRDLTFGGDRPKCPECGSALRLDTRLVHGYGDPRDRSSGMKRAELIILIGAAALLVLVVGAAFLSLFASM